MRVIHPTPFEGRKPSQKNIRPVWRESIGTTGTHSGRLEGLQGHIQGNAWRRQGHNCTARCTSGERVRVPQREPQDHVWSEKNEHDKPLTGVEATFGVRGAGSGLLASTPPRPGQHGCGTARKRK